MIPIYAVCGFLQSGKTHLINQYLQAPQNAHKRILVLQAEVGHQSIQMVNDHQYKEFLEIHESVEHDFIKSASLYKIIEAHSIDEIWFECNGMIKFNDVVKLIENDEFLGDICTFRKCIFVLDGQVFTTIFGRTGDALPEQLTNADIVICHNVESKQQGKSIRQLVKSVNPSAAMNTRSDQRQINKLILRRSVSDQTKFILTLVLIILAYVGLVNIKSTRLITLINIYIGMLLQSFPFLLLGVLISSLILVFVGQDWIEQHFPKRIIPGMGFAILAAFCLPVCDCASIPIFRSLVKKGVPLSVAVTFMCATPIINPLVILSTYLAFGQNWLIVTERIGLGIVASVIVGLCFVSKRPQRVFSERIQANIVVNCGIFESSSMPLERPSWFKRLKSVLQNAMNEFFNIGRYLVVGTLVAALFQVFIPKTFFNQSSFGLLASVLLMMGVAFVLSLCSSSDAVVARSFSLSFPFPAVMAFMIFGPMMDIKNVVMLGANFSRRFIIKLIIVSSLVCFVTALSVALVG